MTLSVRVLHPFCAVLQDEGVALETLLADAQISHQTFSNPDARIAFGALGRFLESAMRRTTLPTLGLRAARRHDTAQFHMLEYLAASSPDTGTALEGVVKHQAVLSEAQILKLESHPEGRLLRYAPQVAVPRCLTEFVMGTLAMTSRRVAARDVKPGSAVQFWFDYPAPPDAQEAYHEFFGRSLVFEAPATGILFYTERLERPMVRANRRVHALLDGQLQVAGSRLEHKASLSTRVEEMLTQTLAGTPMDLPELARRLSMSHATLKRKLAQEGETYSKMLDRIRERTALGLLGQAELNIGEVSYLAGYRDVSSFNRAFKRWTGLSPSEYRGKD